MPFYGLPSAAPDWSQVRVPIQAHFASRDGWAKPEGAQEIQRAIEAGGGTMELHVYEADHAFVNDTRPDVYDAASAKLAWDRAIEFLRRHLA